MFDPKVLLDALVGATSRPGPEQKGSVSSGGQSPQGEADRALGQPTGLGSDLLTKAQDVIAQHPKLSQAAFLGLVGLMFGRRKSGGVPSRLAKLGGLALIGGLAYRAYQGRQQSQSATPGVGQSRQQHPGTAPGVLEMPETSRFHPVSQTEDDAMLYLRAMVAAAASDGRVDGAERARIIKGMTEAGIDPDATRWLDQELESPADVDELAAGVNSPEKAAQVYAAARIAIDPDTIQEREFLRQLAEALDLDPSVMAQIDETTDTLR